VNSLLESKPGNLLIEDLDLTNYMTEGRLDCTVTLKHPFPGLDMYDGFDVWGVFIHNGASHLIYDNLTYSGGPSAGNDEAVLLNPDGYTRWFNQPEFDGDGSPLFEYYPGKLADLPSPTAKLNCYKVFADWLGPDDDYRTFITSPGSSEDRGLFRAGHTNSRRYQLKFPVTGGTPVLSFQYAVVASWEPGDPTLTGDPTTYDPGDFPMSANCEEPFFVGVSTVASDMYNNGQGKLGGTFRADVEVFDWQGGSVGHLGVPNEVYRILIEGGFLPTGSHEFSKAELALVASPSTVDSSIFHLEIPDCTPQASGPISFWVIVESDGLHGASYGQGFPAKFPESARRASFKPSTVVVGTVAPPPPPDWTTPVLIDTDSHMPRAIIATDGDLMVVYHKNATGIRFAANDGTGWSTPGLASGEPPLWMNVVEGDSDARVYIGYKRDTTQWWDDRRALRRISDGSWEVKANIGYTGQPAAFVPDDDSTYAALYTYSGGFEIADYPTYAGYGSPSGWADGATTNMASTDIHERDATNHYVGYYLVSSTESARVMRISKASVGVRSFVVLFTGGTGENVDSTAVAMDGTGKLHAVYRHFDGVNYRIGYCVSTDQGSSWTSPIIVRATTIPILKDYVGVDIDSKGVAYITYAEGNIFYMVRSTEAGWADPTTFLDPATIPSGWEYSQPFPLVTPDDHLHVFYIHELAASNYGDLYEITWGVPG
jgi:hypothetical protein